jgi:hypothetical protein
MSSCSTLVSATSDIPWWWAKKARTISASPVPAVVPASDARFRGW